MPTYEYKCNKCEKEYSFKIPYRELGNFFPICDCGVGLDRVLSLANVVKKINKPIKVGQTTENHIKEFSEDLELQF